jgi:predicted AAA+ superfamily ATPase
MLPSYHRSIRKAQRHAPKFYLIDPGIKRALDRTLSVSLEPQTSAYGEAFEHWVIIEFKKLISYQRLDWELSFLRTKDNLEIDLIVDRPGQKSLQVEIKSKNKITEADAKSLETLGKDLEVNAERLLLSNDNIEQKFGSTRALHWIQGIAEVFGVHYKRGSMVPPCC